MNWETDNTAVATESTSQTFRCSSSEYQVGVEDSQTKFTQNDAT